MAHLFYRASLCSVQAEVSPNKQMMYELGEIYRQLFEFIGHTAKWFMKPRIARFFDSFNSEIIPAQEKAIKNIDRSLKLLKQASSVVDSAKVSHVYHMVDRINDQLGVLEKKVDEQRQLYRYDGPVEIGSRMLSILKAIAEGQLNQRQYHFSNSSSCTDIPVR
jgi:hypothetical protein